jgi:acetate---CoA ligase (ADP-forming)
MTRARLQRVFHPRSIAVVGMSDTSTYANSFTRTLSSDADLYFVHPKQKAVFGRPAYPSLRDVGVPVDAVFSLVSAGRTIGVVEEAVEIGAGGVATMAGGFAELGGDGEELQRRLREVARADGMPVIGPNGIGFVNVPENLDLAMITFERRAGGLSAVGHSGAMLAAMAAPAFRPGGVGFNLLISAGNEAVTDSADYLDFLVEDPGTKVIALMLEKIRRPELFFAAAARAQRAGKPIVAMKMGRGERARRMALSHTGTLTGDAWVYDMAFRQAGIQIVGDIDELIDCVQVLEQLDQSRWSPINGLAVLTMTGGFAQLASDLAEAEHVEVPEVTRLREWVGERVPGATVPNPLDATGFVGVRPGLWEDIIQEYASAEEFDILLLANQHADWNSLAEPHARQLVDAARRNGKLTVLAPLAGNAGTWLDPLRAGDVAVTNGLRPTFRALATMSRFMRTPRTAAVRDPASVPLLPRPTDPTFAVAEGRMLGFDATMRLLADAGIPVCPYQITDGSGPRTMQFPGPYVVKLADLAHRTEHGAVRVRVGAEDLRSVCADLAALASELGVLPTLAIQPMLSGYAEAFIGMNAASELGPVVAFGPGGVFVEVLKRVSGRLAPLSADDALGLLGDFADLGILEGVRGGPPWDVAALVPILEAAGRLVAGGREWIESIDVNPLILTTEGIVAVDGLCLVKEGQRSLTCRRGKPWTRPGIRKSARRTRLSSPATTRKPPRPATPSGPG